MKKIISILLFLLCLVCTADAQNFAPGEQAQGLLENKHIREFCRDHLGSVTHLANADGTLAQGLTVRSSLS